MSDTVSAVRFGQKADQMVDRGLLVAVPALNDLPGRADLFHCFLPLLRDNPSRARNDAVHLGDLLQPGKHPFREQAED